MLFECEKSCLTFIFFLDRAAFFRAQIEERRTSRMASWFSSGDLDVLVAVSSIGVYLVEPREGVRYCVPIGSNPFSIKP